MWSFGLFNVAWEKYFGFSPPGSPCMGGRFQTPPEGVLHFALQMRTIGFGPSEPIYYQRF